MPPRKTIVQYGASHLSPPVEPTSDQLNADFVEDITVPDWQNFLPGVQFTKCWRLKNNGSCSWPESTELIFVAGYALHPSGVIGRYVRVPVGKVAPGGTIDVQTEVLQAPSDPDDYVGHWRLRANGELFGSSVCVAIKVVEELDSESESESESEPVNPKPTQRSKRPRTHS